MTTTGLSSLAGGAVLFLCFANAARGQVDGWKPIVGTASYSRLTQQLPSATINVENGDSIGENSVTFHGSHLIGASGGVEDPILSVGSGSVVSADGTEGRFLGDISSDYFSSGSKVFNGLYSNGGVSVNLRFSDEFFEFRLNVFEFDVLLNFYETFSQLYIRKF